MAPLEMPLAQCETSEVFADLILFAYPLTPPREFPWRVHNTLDGLLSH